MNSLEKFLAEAKALRESDCNPEDWVEHVSDFTALQVKMEKIIEVAVSEIKDQDCECGFETGSDTSYLDSTCNKCLTLQTLNKIAESK